MDFVSSVRSVKVVTAVSDPQFESFRGDGGILEVKTSDLILRVCCSQCHQKLALSGKI